MMEPFTESGNLLALNETVHHCDVDNERETTLAEGIAIFIAAITIIFNFVILLAIVKGPSSLKKPPYWFIASLAAADLLTGAEVVLAIVIPVGTSPLSRIALKGLAVVTFIASINSLTLVSFDRFIRIRHYAKYEQILNEKRAFFLIVISWVVAFFVFLFIPLMHWSCADLMCCAKDGLCVCAPEHEDECNRVCSITFVPFTKGYLIGGVCYFVLSVAIMIIFYAMLFQVVKKRTFERTPASSSNSKGSIRDKKRAKTSKREIRLAKTLAITLGIFVVCWFPVIILFFMDIFTTKKATIFFQKAFDMCLIPSIINSCLNPVIYAYRIPKMKQIVERNICSLLCISPSSTSSFYNNRSQMTSSSTNQHVRRRSTRRLKSQTMAADSENSGMVTATQQQAGDHTQQKSTTTAMKVSAVSCNNNNNILPLLSLTDEDDDTDMDQSSSVQSGSKTTTELSV